METCVQSESGNEDPATRSLLENAPIPGHSIISQALDVRAKKEKNPQA